MIAMITVPSFPMALALLVIQHARFMIITFMLIVTSVQIFHVSALPAPYRLSLPHLLVADLAFLSFRNSVKDALKMVLMTAGSLKLCVWQLTYPTFHQAYFHLLHLLGMQSLPDPKWSF